jgi:hypothetical protein
MTWSLRKVINWALMSKPINRHTIATNRMAKPAVKDSGTPTMGTITRKLGHHESTKNAPPPRKQWLPRAITQRGHDQR